MKTSLNIENQVLSKKQMQKLIDMGVDVSKASMCWFPKLALDNNTKFFVKSHFLGINHIDHDSYWNTTEGKNTIPTFTLQDLLNLLKSSLIEIKHEGKGDSENHILYDFAIESINISWIVRYHNPTFGDIHYEEHSSLLEACFNMLKWRKRNNHI